MIYILVVLTILYLLRLCLVAIWNIFLHPLCHIPGPKLWIAFPIIRYIALVRGRLDINMRAFHIKYGEVVRSGPDEVSFITAQAWKDIYSHGHQQMVKVRHSTSNPSDIISANDADHSRFRRALSHAFSAKGLQLQESILISYVDKLIERLKGVSESQTPADMVKWYNLTTFDLIGDLAFGEPFGGLESSKYHHWVSTIFQAVRAMVFVRFKDAYPLLFTALYFFPAPANLLEMRKRQIEYSSLTVQKRLKTQINRGGADFMESMLRHRGEKDGLTDKELEANANVLIIAGSETTATLLSGVTYWLLRSPKALEKVTQELRSTMKTELDITFHNTTAQLPYMLACLNEAFRMYPPVPTGVERMTTAPDPVEISGYWIPSGTKVSVHQSAAYRSPSNFHNPDHFMPERWLPEVKNDPSSPFYYDNRDVLQPFSTGPRNCIGRNLAYSEMRVILTRVLWNFDLELCEESRGWHNQLSYMLWEKPPLMCRLKPRSEGRG